MSFADPIVLNLNTVSTTLNRVSGGTDRLSVYATADGNATLTVRQDKSANRFRREIRLSTRKVAADPISAQNKEVSASMILVVDQPKFGYTLNELQQLFFDAMTYANTATNRAKLIGGEL